ncbi:hypothetical protein BRADI_1g15660v3 [Brachypodium distachyon]|uniref:Uncharacterized protein n=1 Tax=Brachypodium distachyon TaxID=15368 RepID=A0A0Q3RN20_BRADI|nr:hypothetical protein BRADI_1g15660v3 [Brachypodium distachyon]
MSSSPRALLELMTAVDAGLVAPPVDVIDGRANLGSSRRRGSSSYSRSRQTAPVVAKTIIPVLPVFSTLDTDPSFEFSTAISNSSASPASMVFSDGHLRAHQFPAVRSSSPGTGASSQVGSPVLGTAKAGSTKRVSFAEDGTAGKTAAGKSRKGGGLLGCMGSTCRLSRSEVVEPAMNANHRKAVSV